MSVNQSASDGMSVGREACFWWMSASASRDGLRASGSDGTDVTCTSGATMELMAGESRLRSRDGRLERRTIAKCTLTDVGSWVQWRTSRSLIHS